MDAAVRDAESHDAAVRAMAELSVERRELGVLWQREVRHLPEAVRAEMLPQFRGLALRLQGLILDRRGDLGVADASLLNWAMLAVLGSPSRSRAGLSDGRLVELLEGAARTLLTAHLPADGRDSGGQ